MTDSERKIKLKKMIASLSPSQLKRAYKEINNFLNNQSDADDWAPDVTQEEKEAIEAGLNDLKMEKQLRTKK